MEIADKTVVSLRYCMKNSKGHVLENILDKSPVEYLHGVGNIMPALENSLQGLKPGAKTTVIISSKIDLRLDDEFHFDVIIDAVRVATEEEIKKGTPLKAETKNECGPGCCC